MSGSLEALTRPSAFFVRHASRTSTNTRIPPIARRSASPIPSRMAMLSRDKLERETAAKNPDLRRCLSHQRLLRRSIEAAQEDMRKAMASFKLEDSDDEDEILGDDYDSSPSPMIREQITRAVKAMVKRRATSQAHETNNANSTPQLMRGSIRHNGASQTYHKIRLYPTAVVVIRPVFASNGQLTSTGDLLDNANTCQPYFDYGLLIIFPSTLPLHLQQRRQAILETTNVTLPLFQKLLALAC
ncbi:hypothetical protein P875_00086536 [Aspergillus parasiticus SU-1]|uniref:Uncharacterized protein n=1 Tax=Aspergillus parasiticus (strain ATCC 56775 / NRRL 5862 / SRRC 143 / SU-1) TaxID=1403190 RepID=A0A0F0I436_ASPPU|nr:hypothetical protein P875_00086536 [Aspergillus parasiticus SU-1]